MSFQLVGDSTQTLSEIANDLIPILAKRKELRDVRVDVGDQNSELNVRVDRERAAAFGFSAEEVARFVSLALRGAPLREFRRGETEVPVWVRFAGAEDYGTDDLSGFMVRAPDGRTVPLLALVDVGVQPSATQIQRTNRQTTLSVQANLAEKATVPEARKALEETLKGMSFPAGYSYSFDGGAFQEEDEASAQMMFNLLIALVMIYIVMAAVFESLLFPAAIMSGVLFSVFGVFWLFALTGTTFGIMSFIGILVLMGVVVNNGIVMVEHINNLRRRGLSRPVAYRCAGGGQSRAPAAHPDDDGHGDPGDDPHRDGQYADGGRRSGLRTDGAGHRRWPGVLHGGQPAVPADHLRHPGRSAQRHGPGDRAGPHAAR